MLEVRDPKRQQRRRMRRVEAGMEPVQPKPRGLAERVGICGRAVPHETRVPTPDNANNPYFHTIIPNGAWQGQRCFLIGGGPSLRGFDFSKLRGELVIGINRAFEFLDPALVFSVDRRLLAQWILPGKLGEDVKKRWGQILATKVWLRDVIKDYPEEVYIIDTHFRERFTPCLHEGFGRTNNSGFGALSLACALGAKDIYLLGYDQKGNPATGRQEWFHSGYPEVDGARCYQQNMIPLFERYAPAMRAKGHNVVNLNRDSALRCFRFGDLADLPAKPTRPLVIGYHTRDSIYPPLARRMLASIHRFGLEADLRSVPPFDGWQSATHYKARFIKKMLKEYPKRPLLFLDADVEMRRYPAIFDNLNADIAVNIVDWSQYSSISRKDRELNTSVVYIRNTRRVMAMLDEWIAMNDRLEHTGRWEQKNLQDVLEKWTKKLKVKLLPDAYCQIFDLMREAGEPVIELYQASRKSKAIVGA